MSVKILSIVGKSGSGKTTLIEKLIPALERRGFRVATIKHDVHGFEMDRPGKDTYRHFAAGARTVLIASPEKLAFQKRLPAPLTIDEIAARYIDGVDIILTEGYKSSDKPKIEVFRRERSPSPLCGPQDNRVAIVTDDEVEVDCPRYELNDVDGIAEFIIANFIEPRPISR
ncbi:MAG TPA: molybdopterin-guanine dinucleotide biosynthesis protein B [bacterium]|nr:molybdopterin-guanine dinucleotide biosynthesis protein B [bacterium]